jgi:hypothetical protein
MRMDELGKKRRFGPDAAADRRRFLEPVKAPLLVVLLQCSHLPAVNLTGSKHLFGAPDLAIKL